MASACFAPFVFRGVFVSFRRARFCTVCTVLCRSAIPYRQPLAMLVLWHPCYAVPCRAIPHRVVYRTRLVVHISPRRAIPYRIVPSRTLPSCLVYRRTAVPLWQDYLVYAEESKDELPLYVFDKRFVDKCADLGKEYDVPQVFPVSEFCIFFCTYVRTYDNSAWLFFAGFYSVVYCFKGIGVAANWCNGVGSTPPSPRPRL